MAKEQASFPNASFYHCRPDFTNDPHSYSSFCHHHKCWDCFK